MLLNKIVVAEDDDAIAHMVNMALGDAGFLCLRARNGEEAVDLVKVQSPDLLILDVMMPRCDGMEVVKRLRGDVLTSKTPILMLTALSTVENKVEGLEAGADDYVTKPFDLRELAARVKALIRASRRERDRNPATNLPGSSAVERHLGELLSKETGASVLHAHAVGFGDYVAKHGYARADKLVKNLGTAVLNRARAAADHAFVGHLGGVDFVVTCDRGTAESLAQDLVRTFDDNVAKWTDGEALRMTIAVVGVEGIGPDDAGGGQELASRMAAALRASKQRDGSNHVVWAPGIGD
jgi:DNA-binding response OmpR family regulator